MSVTTEFSIASIGDFTERLPEPGTVDVTIEVLGEDVGDQIQVQRLPWHALIYDEPNDIIELSVGSRRRSVPIAFRHEIHDPRHLWVEEDHGLVRAVSIEDGSGRRTIVTFFDRDALEAGS